MSGASPSTWMPWFPGDFLKHTIQLDADEDGAYRRLIDACWIANGLLSDDDGRLSRITKLPLKKWLKVRPILAPFFQQTEHGWRHKRVDDELERARANIKRAAAGGRAKANSGPF